METNITTQNTVKYIEVDTEIYNDDNPLVDLYMYGILIIVPVIIAVLFYGIKKLLKKIGFLTKKISDTLDNVQHKITVTATKASAKFINKKYKTNKQLPSSGLAVDISEKINETLTDKLKVDIDEPVKDNNLINDQNKKEL